MVIDRERRVIELRADLLIPGYYSNSKRKGQVPCEVCNTNMYPASKGMIGSLYLLIDGVLVTCTLLVRG